MTVPSVSQPKLPLRPETADEARIPLSQLFAAYPEPWADRSASHAQELIAAKVNAYLLALSGLPAWAIQRAVLDFIQGRIERKSRDRLPTAEQVAVEARKHLDAEAMKQARDRSIEAARAEQRASDEFMANRPSSEERARIAARILARHGLRQMPSEE